MVSNSNVKESKKNDKLYYMVLKMQLMKEMKNREIYTLENENLE